MAKNTVQSVDKDFFKEAKDLNRLEPEPEKEVRKKIEVLDENGQLTTLRKVRSDKKW
jgi:hypothetical protein